MNSLDPSKVLVSTCRGNHVYDLRNLYKRVFSVENHLDEVTHCGWSPHRELVFAGSSRDRRLGVIDMGEIDRYSMNDAATVQNSVMVSFVSSSSTMKVIELQSFISTGTKVKILCLSPQIKTACRSGS